MSELSLDQRLKKTSEELYPWVATVCDGQVRPEAKRALDAYVAVRIEQAVAPEPGLADTVEKATRALYAQLHKGCDYFEAKHEPCPVCSGLVHKFTAALRSSWQSLQNCRNCGARTERPEGFCLVCAHLADVAGPPPAGDAAYKVLLRYGSHDHYCAVESARREKIGWPAECSCGFDEALRAALRGVPQPEEEPRNYVQLAREIEALRVKHPLEVVTADALKVVLESWPDPKGIAEREMEIGLQLLRDKKLAESASPQEPGKPPEGT